MGAKPGKIVSTNETAVDMKTIDLLEAEGSPMGFMYVPGVNALSFFSGNFEEATEYYSTRLALIIKRNRWLAGTLITKKEGKEDKVYLLYREKEATDEEARSDLLGPDSKICKAPLLVLDKEGSVKVSPTNSYLANFSAVNAGKCLIPDGYTSISTKLPLSKFTLIKCGDNSFALVASISHVIGDGNTFYKIMGMLTGTEENVTKLDADRKHTFTENHPRLMGKEQHNFLFGMNMYNMGFIYQMIGNFFCCRNKRVSSYFIDLEKVGKMKEKNGKCTTHDIITSHFCNVTKPRLLQYAVNLRPRMEELNDDDAGNYESCVLMSPQSYTTPAGVREVIESVKGETRSFSHCGTDPKSDPLPRGCGALRAKSSILTSWCFHWYSGDLSFGNCKMDLHVPMVR